MSSEGKSSAASGGGAALVPGRRFPEFAAMAGWDTVSGNELFQQINNRQAPPGLPILAITQEHGAIPRDLIGYHVSVTDQSVETYKEVKPGDFIISLRSFQGGIEYSNYHGICSPAYVILRKRADISDQFFKQHFKSRSFIQQLTRNLEGLRDGKMISYKQFSELRFLKPTLPEQQKIADCLDSVDALIAAQGQKVEALRAHKKGLMRQLFPLEGKTQPRLRFPEFEGAGEWVHDNLGNLFDITSGGTPERTKEEYWNGGIPWITTSMVNFNVITEAAEYISETGLKNSSAKIFPEKTILLAMYGQGKTRGQVAMLGVKAATNQACAAILPRKGINPNFVFLNLGSRYDELRGLSNSGGQENLSQGLIKALLFSYPSDPVEQQRIADCLTSLDDLLAAETRKLGMLKTHKKGLIQQLFPQVGEAGA
ncbi:restriction endonuclease subunit S [Rhizobium sp. AU243]|uniref:restriction endonuclease subunit S n=1 Tax=Rhizobium sp. AU243 TaxID=2303425 RepID=UPI0010CBF6AD|nr:restriction endonuclease subunit S [Rhizobium sp. AU243]TKV75338.1 restriction endonuclease subunit S [Rhizobium sp. AU243]